MIIFHKNLNEIRLGNTKLLKYSEDFTFIPLKILNNNKFVSCVFQTPKLFIPYGKQKLENGKYIMDLSFQNKENDRDCEVFLNKLKEMYSLIKLNYGDKNVNPFLKETPYDYTMRLKLSPSVRFYDTLKNNIYKVDPFVYGTFIIQLEGLWVCNGEIWFQWYILQGRIETPVLLNEYSFADETTKYDKMKKMGIPQGAIDLQKKIDHDISITSSKPFSKIPPPPPPPSALFNTNKPVVAKIKAEDLRSIVLKKCVPTKKKVLQIGFEPPSLEELQITLSNLKKIIS